MCQVINIVFQQWAKNNKPELIYFITNSWHKGAIFEFMSKIIKEMKLLFNIEK